MFFGQTSYNKIIFYMKEPSGWNQSSSIEEPLERVTPLLFMILIFTYLPLKCSKLAIIWFQPLLITLLQDSYNLRSKSMCVMFVMVKILYSITVPLNMLPHYIEDSGTLHVSKVKSENGNLLIAHLVSAKKYQILVSKIRSDSMYLLFAYDVVCM